MPDRRLPEPSGVDLKARQQNSATSILEFDLNKHSIIITTQECHIASRCFALGSTFKLYRRLAQSYRKGTEKPLHNVQQFQHSLSVKLTQSLLQAPGYRGSGGTEYTVHLIGGASKCRLSPRSSL